MKRFSFSVPLIFLLATQLFSQPVLYPDNFNVIELPEFIEPSSEPTIKKPSSELAPAKVLLPPRQLFLSSSSVQESLLFGTGSYETFILGVSGGKTTVNYQFQQKKVSRNVFSRQFQETTGKIVINNLNGNLFYYFAPEIADTLIAEQRKTTFQINPTLKYFLNKDNYLEFETQASCLNLNNTSFVNSTLFLNYFHYFNNWSGISLGAKKQLLAGEHKSRELSSAKISLLLDYPEWLSGEFSILPFINDQYFYSGILTLVPFPNQRFRLSYQQNYQYFILTKLYSPKYIYNSLPLPPLDESNQTSVSWQYLFPDKLILSLGYQKIYEKNGPVYFTPLNGYGNPQNYVDINYQPDLNRNFWVFTAEEKAGIFNFQQGLTLYSGEKITYQPELTGYTRVTLNFTGINLGAKYEYRSEWYYNSEAPALPENKFLSLLASFCLGNFTTLNLEIENIAKEKIYHQPDYFTDEPLIFLTFIAKI